MTFSSNQPPGTAPWAAPRGDDIEVSPYHRMVAARLAKNIEILQFGGSDSNSKDILPESSYAKTEAALPKPKPRCPIVKADLRKAIEAGYITSAKDSCRDDASVSSIDISRKQRKGEGTIAAMYAGLEAHHAAWCLADIPWLSVKTTITGSNDIRRHYSFYNFFNSCNSGVDVTSDGKKRSVFAILADKKLRL